MQVVNYYREQLDSGECTNFEPTLHNCYPDVLRGMGEGEASTNTSLFPDLLEEGWSRGSVMLILMAFTLAQ